MVTHAHTTCIREGRGGMENTHISITHTHTHTCRHTYDGRQAGWISWSLAEMALLSR